MRSTKAKDRKSTPVFTGFLKYFPDAICAVAIVSKKGSDQHHEGEELHWDRAKSTDEYDACSRHLIDRAAGDEFDTDGQRHMAKVAWRALAAVQKEIENENSKNFPMADYHCKYCGIKGTYNEACAPCTAVKIESKRAGGDVHTLMRREDA